MVDHSGHAHGHAPGRRQLVGQAGDHLDEFLWCQRVGGGGAHRLGVHGAGGVEHGGLDSAASAVDRESNRLLWHAPDATDEPVPGCDELGVWPAPTSPVLIRHTAQPTPWCASASIWPTTAPTSPAGPHNLDCVPSKPN